MFNRTFTASTLSLTLALAAGMVGCATDNNSAENQGAVAKANAHNRTCPVCGVDADSNYTVWRNGSAVNCCSQGCCDQFNRASDNDKQMWVNKANKSVSSNENWNDGSTSEEARVSTFPTRNTTTYNDRANTTTYTGNDTLNRTCPITGKSASNNYTFVDADGQRIAFSSQEAADTYMSYGPEHRAEVRASRQWQ